MSGREKEVEACVGTTLSIWCDRKRVDANRDRSADGGQVGGENGRNGHDAEPEVQSSSWGGV